MDAGCRLVPLGAGKESLNHCYLEVRVLRIPYPPPFDRKPPMLLMFRPSFRVAAPKTATREEGSSLIVTPQPPRAYVDTCIIIGIRKKGLRPEELAAVRELLRLHEQGAIQLVTSDMAKAEISKGPPEHRSSDETTYNLLSYVSSFIPTMGLNAMDFFMLGWHHLRFRALKRLLPGHLDARHVFAAWRNSVEHFVTTDERTILKHRVELKRQFEVNAVLPTELLAILGGS